MIQDARAFLVGCMCFKARFIAFCVYACTLCTCTTTHDTPWALEIHVFLIPVVGWHVRNRPTNWLANQCLCWCKLETCTNTPQNLGVCFIPCLAPLVLQQTTWDLFLTTPLSFNRASTWKWFGRQDFALIKLSFLIQPKQPTRRTSLQTGRWSDLCFSQG